MAEKFINIKFPFKDSVKGFFLDMSKTDQEAVKADLMHLVLTRKGQRLYMPDFGTDLYKYIFEPNDGITQADIALDIKTTVKKFIPNLTINDVIITRPKDEDHHAIVRLEYTITDDVFESQDFVTITL